MTSRKQRIRRWILGTVIVLVPAPAVPADDLRVTRGDFTSRLVLTGELVADEAVNLVVPNANIWPVQIRWLAEDGIEVAAGDTIAEFDNSQLANQLDQLETAWLEARNTLASTGAEARREELSAEFTLEQKKAAIEKAQLDARVPPALLSDREYEERRLALERAEIDRAEALAAVDYRRSAAESKVAQQQVKVTKAELAVQRAREGLELLTMTALRDGVLVISENDETGRTYRGGDNTWPGMILARLPELSSMVVEARLFDVDDGRLAVGMPVEVVVDAFPDEILHGEVVSVDSIAQEAGQHSLRRSFAARVRLEGLDAARARPGMSVRLVVEDREPDVLLVPRVALAWSDGEGGFAARARLAGGGWSAVEIGRCNPALCTVNAGIAEGRRLRAAGEGTE